MININCCVSCGKRTDRSGKLKSRRKITKGWMTNYFKAKSVNVIKYKWICNSCRVKIAALHKKDDLFKETNKLSGLFAKIAINENSYFDKIDEKKLKSHIGLSKSEFIDLYQEISQCNLKGNVLLLDALGLYLTKYYLGKNSKFC